MTLIHMFASDLNPLTWSYPPQVLVNGATAGLVYGTLAVGIVLIFRSSRVINFAYGELAACAAVFMSRLVQNWGWPYLPALVLVVAGGAALSGVIELAVVERLFKAPRVILFVATIGVAQLIVFLELLLPSAKSRSTFPTPFDTEFTIGGVLLRGEHLVVFVVVPLVTVGLSLFLSRTRYGGAIRASAANPDAASLAGISPRRMSTLVWSIAGAFAALTAVLVGPFQLGAGGATGQGSGAGLLLRALAAALIGGMVSVSWALVGGVVIGVLEALLYTNVINTPSLITMVLFVLVLVLVLVRGRAASREDSDEAPWSFAPQARPIPDRLKELWWVRHMPQICAAAGLLVAVILPLVLTRSSSQFLFARMMIFAVVALSVTVLTGWAGQLSLGQFGFVGLGAFSTVAFHNAGVAFLPAVCLAGLIGLGAAIVVGIPALRIKGLFLAVTTIAFAIATQQWLLSRPWFVGESTVAYIKRSTVGPFDLSDQRTYYYLCLFGLVVAFALVARLRKSGIGRAFIATRDNERAAAAFTISPARAKLLAFAISGGLCGVAGGLLAGLLVRFGIAEFPVDASLSVVTIAVIGGLGTLAGPILGAMWVIGLPAAFGDDPNVALLSSGLGLLVLLLYFPGGLAGAATIARDWLLAFADRRMARRAPDASVAPASAAPAPAPRALPERSGSGRKALDPEIPALAVTGLSVRFGGIVAVDDLTLSIPQGHVVGLIGANGAGKTTLMNAVGGFLPATGSVELLGDDVSDLNAAQRARRGLGRTFQQAHLFPDLTVRETVATALEGERATPILATVFAVPTYRRAERRKLRVADELIGFVGLGRYADSFIRELSTGTRRLVELCCLLAVDARVLCLDEPTAGVAQRETEAFGPLLLGIRKELDATMLIIEHDMSLVFSVSDTVHCLESGRLIASGTPAEVRHDPLVVASYLGTDERAIQRSDTSVDNVPAT